MRGKILLVDDDAALREEFRYLLREYEIIEASSAAEALEIIGKPNEVDLVIMDFQMPGMDGLTALKKIKSMAPEKGVIIMTGYSTKDVAIEALRLHADGYVEKPFEIKELRSAVEKELAARSGTEAPAEAGPAGRIEYVKSYIERNCFKKVTLKEASSAVGLSQKYLSRLFHEHAGCGFTQFRLKVKMQRAAELLESTSMSIKQISFKLGYENAVSFMRQFKKINGHTPSSGRGCGKKKKK